MAHFEIADSVTIEATVIERNYTLDLTKLSGRNIEDLIRHAVKQLLGDSAAGLKDEPGKAQEKIEKALEKIQLGQFVPGVGGGRRIDPVSAEVKAMAEARWKKLGAKGKTIREMLKDHSPLDVFFAAVYVSRLEADKRHMGSPSFYTNALEWGMDLATEENQNKVLAQAQENIRAREVEMDLDLDLDQTEE